MYANPSDKELLELAAKAEGHGVYFDVNSGNTLIDDEYTGILWNPLYNDGDALRLAVNLCLFESFDFSMDLSRAQSADNPHEATRRAIVRAAAEIARSN